MRYASRVDGNQAVWKCAGCEIERKMTAHRARNKYCSKECYLKSIVRIENKPCIECGKPVNGKPGSKTKYCSYACFGIACSRERSSPLKKCIHCGKDFKSSPSEQQIYCSYECHLASGGAFRAGMASAKAKMRYGAKKDANHKEIFDEFNRLDIPVKDLSVHGCGLPDGLAWICDAWHLFDVKNLKTAYGRRGLNEVQKKWVGQWKGGPVYLIHSIEEVAKFAAGDFASLKKEGGKCETTPEKV